ncbi:hypothetical protein TNCV_3418201 [Trichonephila clavipes]|nr:hypothetical protein TNCV_3418201 [Trichonephila clavipes]
MYWQGREFDTPALGDSGTFPLQLGPCNYRIFGPLKKAVKGGRFSDDNKVQGWLKIDSMANPGASSTMICVMSWIAGKLV